MPPIENRIFAASNPFEAIGQVHYNELPLVDFLYCLTDYHDKSAGLYDAVHAWYGNIDFFSGCDNRNTLLKTLKMVEELQGHDDDRLWQQHTHNSPFELSRKKTLDLGSGFISQGEGIYLPFTPSILGALGADAYGVDVGEQFPGSEYFYTHVKADILDLTPSALPKMLQGAEGTFDWVACTGIFLTAISPTMRKSVRAHRMSLSQVTTGITILAHHLLADGGLLYLEMDGGIKVKKKLADGWEDLKSSKLN